MLSANNISKSFGGKTIIKDLSLSVQDGSFTCLLGGSGCGKTTLMRLLAGLEKPDSGEVKRDGSARVSVVFQEDRLLPWRNALENVSLFCGDKKAAVEYLEKTGLGDEYMKFPDELSGGMKRRLSIARALAFGGNIFFLDEPIRELDPENALSVLELIKDETKGKTVFMITHDIKEAEFLADRIIIADGAPFRITGDSGRDGV